MTGRIFLRMAALALVAVLFVAAPMDAQEQPKFKIEKGPDYSRGKTNPLAVYAPLRVETPQLQNSPRVEQLVKDGKLQLTLKDAIALALENNLDISVARFTPWIADTDVLRTKSGGAGRGLAGTGTASVLGTIPSTSFDPTYTSSFSWDRRSIPINNPFLAGTGVALSALTNYSTQWNNQISQGFHTGTGYAISWNNTRSSSTNPSTFLNPSVQSTLFFSFSQQLLNGFGLLANTRFILSAKNGKKIADLAFSEQVITTVSSVQNMYWDLVFAREDVKVKQRSVELAEKLYNDNKRQVEIGTLAPIEVVRAEAEVARTRQDFIVAQTFLLQQQTLIKNALTKNPATPGIINVEVVPTDAIIKPPVTEPVTLEQAVKEAWEKRPELRRLQIDLQNRDINVKATRNALLPTLSLAGQYGGTGLAGNSRTTTKTLTGTFTSTGTPIVDSAGAPLLIGGVPAFLGSPVSTSTTTLGEAGWGGALGRMKNFDFPTYSVQLSLNIPILNRAAQADNARAQLEKSQAETSFRRQQNTIVVEVRNAQISLEQNRARVEAAQKSRELAERTLDAEQKKYQLGASTIFFVIQAQRDLAAAQSAEVSALVALTKSNVEYERALGRTLEVNNITLAEAKGGALNQNPLIPGTPTAELVGAPAKF
ncbi:MAG: TolC family protein [Acidobacteria bacterium]|nr:TolC family protein [Acidobacteriota bacterium]MBI3663158.1 TolC family protein [Acidobacteriota bacterium]